MERFRVAFGVVIAAAAFALVFNLDTKLQTWLPGWTEVLQRNTEASAAGTKAYSRGQNLTAGKVQPATAAGIPDYGPAPDFRGIQQWINSKPLTLAGLRGKVVLIDFWTYSCINCLRTLPHVEAWWSTYHRKGLVIVGVHTPEFAFEHDPGNVREATQRLGVEYPVALDGDYGTWNAWSNQYWPAKYLIDKQGHVRYAHFGEGEYDKTEQLIRRLLSQSGDELPVASRLVDPTPTELMTPETYLGFQRLERYAGSRITPGVEKMYRFPASLGPNELAYGGRWRVDAERVVEREGRPPAAQLRRQERLSRARRDGARSGAAERQGHPHRPRLRPEPPVHAASGVEDPAAHPRAPLHPGHLRLRLHLRLWLSRWSRIYSGCPSSSSRFRASCSCR